MFELMSRILRTEAFERKPKRIKVLGRNCFWVARKANNSIKIAREMGDSIKRFSIEKRYRKRRVAREAGGSIKPRVKRSTALGSEGVKYRAREAGDREWAIT